ncbi:MAG: hypothetical protein JXQ23_04685 [Clostridia bacterium]|nr:hypothetical protein [Clostridia bacterium]
MRKILIMIICLVLMAGCKQSGGIEVNTEVPMESEQSKPSASQAINVHPVDLLRIIIPTRTSFYNNMETWQLYFKDRYDINISPEFAIGDFSEFISQDGVVYLNDLNYQLFNFLGKYGFNDISSFYYANGYENDMDDKLNEIININMKEEDRGIYGITSLLDESFESRFYNKKYLDELELTVPETLDEFTAYLYEVKRSHESITPFIINHTYLSVSSADIFRAYGCYVNLLYGGTIAYNPITKAFEDAVFDDRFNEALMYFDLLQNDGLLKLYSPQENQPTESEDIATEYKATFYKNRLTKDALPFYEYEVGNSLIGINSKYLIEYKKNIGVYLFPKTIENLEGTLVLFDYVMNNTSMSADLRYGIENVDYTIENDEVKKTDVINKSLDLTMTSKMNQGVLTKEMSSDSYFENSLLYSAETYKPLLSLEASFKTSKFISVSGQRDFFVPLFNTEISIDERIEEYKKDFIINGESLLLKELNEKINATSSYKY